MPKVYLTAATIAERLKNSLEAHTRWLKNKILVLDLTQFHAAADRDKVEDSVFVDVVRILRRKDILLFRQDAHYILIASATFEAMPSPTALETKSWRRSGGGE